VNFFKSPYFVMFVGIFTVSTGAIFTRLAQEEDIGSLTISAGRVLVATIVLTPIVFNQYRHEIAKLTQQDIGLALLSGVVLGAHFATWVSSLEYTSVIASVVLVTTNPLFVAVLSYPILGERVSKFVLAGIFVSFIGGIIVAASGDAGEPPTRPDPLLGNGLAILGAIGAALYFLLGRRLRAKLSVIPYIWLVYGTAAIVLSGVVILSNEQITGHSSMGYIWIIALGLIPQLLGHSSFNYALGYLPAAYVSLVILGEPVGSTILAILFLGEYPSIIAILGALIIMAGIGIASRKPRRTTQVKYVPQEIETH